MVNIDTVYQKVLAIANKEQRGYITPQEFNLIAQQAQQEIFEQYFYDAKSEDKNLKNSTEFSNIDEILDEKLSIFKAFSSIATSGQFGTLPSNLYRIGTVIENNNKTEVEQISEDEVIYLNKSPLTKPTALFPAYYRSSQFQIQTYPPLSNISCRYIRVPTTPKWGYVVVNEKALYDPSTSMDFELHKSDTTELVYKILSLAGIVIAKPGLGSYADAQINAQKQQEKQ